MSFFYTNVFRRGNNIFVKGYDMGLRFEEKIHYNPYLFIAAKNGDYRTIDNIAVKKLNFDSMKDARNFIDRYQDVSNFKYYGLTNFEYVYINDTFKDGFKYDIDKIKIGVIDIECAADEGFPDIRTATKPVTAITIKSNGKTFVFGCGDFTTNDRSIEYVKCKDEYELFTQFLECWNTMDLDIITGWNCIPTDQFVWGKNQILPISQIKNVYNNNLINISPISTKNKYEITLANGKVLHTSKDHKLIVKEIPSDKYTTLNINNKNNEYLMEKVLTTEECMNSSNSLFVEYPLRINDNLECDYTNTQLYLAGLIYTDGSLKNSDNIKDGFQIYQSDLDMLIDIKNVFNIDTKCIGPYKDNYALYINHSMINDASNLIYIDNKKKLNVTELSKLSYSQFMIFLSGLLDGDGCASQGNISICNYNNDIQPLNELLQWNGIFAIQQSDNMLRLVDYNFNDLSLLKKKRWNFVPNLSLLRNSSQKAKNIRFRKIGKDYFVKIKSIVKTDILCDMMDIETEDHTFITNGVKVHNCEFFDIPYLVNRMKLLFDKDVYKRLSPYLFVDEKLTTQYGKEVQTYTIQGISTLDYYHIYRKFSFKNQESYTLDYIAEIELKEKKLDYSQYGSLLELYKKNFQKFIEYNIKDVVLVEKLEKSLNFIKQIIAIAYDAKVNYVDTLTTIRPWDIIIHNYLMNKKIVVPQMKDNKMEDPLMGGYVKDPIVGMHEWIVSFDLTSLYPHLIMQYNNSPETFVDQIDIHEFGTIDDYVRGKKVVPHDNKSWTANACSYRKDFQGFLPTLMENMFADRARYKKLMLEAKNNFEKTESHQDSMLISKYHNMQMAKKIQLNSVYGALANIYFRWFDFKLAESITSSGQLTIQFIEKKINEYLNKIMKTTGVDYVVASDTDSVYLNLGSIVNKHFRDKDTNTIVNLLDKFCKNEITPFLDRSFQELANNMNAYSQKMFMKRETIAAKGIWRRKKMYILNAWDIEGVRYTQPILKIQGIEAVRSSTPKVCRDAIKETLSIIMNKDEKTLQEYILNFRNEFKKMPFEKVAFPRSVNGMDKYNNDDKIYGLKTPIHTKGALLFNNMLKKHKINTIAPIRNGDKIKFAYLLMPNPVNDTVISATDKLPEDFTIDKYIDKDMQFEKAYLEPIRSITDLIGWRTEPRIEITDFF